MAPPNFVALIIYFVAQQVVKQLFGNNPPGFVGWVPILAGVSSFFLLQTRAQAGASAKTSQLVGQPAPDVSMDFLTGASQTLKQLIADTRLPTVVDFYQNFCPACGPAAQQIDKLAAEYKGRANFVLLNMTSTTDANSYAKSKSLAGHALHGAAKGGVPAEYGIMYIPHKVLIAADGTVVKNGTNLVLPGDLDALLARKEDKSSAKSE